MSVYGTQDFKIKRKNAGQEEYNSNDKARDTVKFSLLEKEEKNTTAKADRTRIVSGKKHAEFEFNIYSPSEADADILRALNYTTCTFWPFADTASFSFECIVQVEPKRPYSGWRDIDFYNIKIRSKKEVVIETAIAQGIAGWDFMPDPGADPTTTGTAGYDLMTEVL